MKVGDLVLTKYGYKVGIVIDVDETHCAVFIHDGKVKRNRLYRISKDCMEVI